MRKPIIGITLDYSEKQLDQGGYSNHPWYALRLHYAQAVKDHGGLPIHIPYEHELIDEYVDLCSGFIIPGGDIDVDPKYYHEHLRPETKLSPHNVRPEFELALMRKIIAKKMPLLGICWGEQLLNVLLGGTLYQDIPAEIGTEIAHKSKQPHEIEVRKDSLLYKIVGRERYKVNTSHHQSVKKPGANLIVSAVAADGVIEAIEHTGQPFCIGVEWHPEYLDSEQDKKLMRAFIEAANTYNAKD